MICDKLYNLGKYEVIRKYEDEIKNFISSIDMNNFKSGKYFIEGDNIYAILTSYKTKDKKDTPIESHKEYYDLVVVLEGEERMYVDFVDDMVVDNVDKNKDMIYYKNKEEAIRITMTPGIFTLFDIGDVHHPYCVSKKEEQIKKVTFKIKI